MDFQPKTIDMNQGGGGGGGRPPVRLILIGVVVLAIVLVGSSTVFTIPPEEVGVVLRFGRYTRVAEPGLNFKLPSPIEQMYRVPVQRQLKEEFGFQTEEAGVRTRYSSRNFEGESLMLTGDLNVAVVEWTTQYRVAEPEKYLVKVRNPRKSSL